MINPLERVVIGMSAEGVYAYNYHAFQWVYQTHNLTTNKTVIPYIYILVNNSPLMHFIKKHTESRQIVVLHAVIPFRGFLLEGFYTVMLCFDVTIGPHPLVGQILLVVICRSECKKKHHHKQSSYPSYLHFLKCFSFSSFHYKIMYNADKMLTVALYVVTCFYTVTL